MLTTYHGSCHCGAVRFEAELDLAAASGRCNCSICTKRRNWSMLLKPAQFRLVAGADVLSDYQFASNSGHHRFCRNCGCAPFGDGHVPEIGGDYVAVSLACLDDAPPEALAAVPVTYRDGRRNAWWEVPAVTSYL